VLLKMMIQSCKAMCVSTSRQHEYAWGLL
jgi:hypothetical protein